MEIAYRTATTAKTAGAEKDAYVCRWSKMYVQEKTVLVISLADVLKLLTV